MTHEQYMRRCLELATAALAQGEVPVGAVIVDGDRIGAEDHRVLGSRHAPRSLVRRHRGNIVRMVSLS